MDVITGYQGRAEREGHWGGGALGQWPAEKGALEAKGVYDWQEHWIIILWRRRLHYAHPTLGHCKRQQGKKKDMWANLKWSETEVKLAGGLFVFSFSFGFGFPVFFFFSFSFPVDLPCRRALGQRYRDGDI